MPEPVRGDQKYLPGLDGLRALAVTAVVAYHLGFGWAQGGLLGVGVFFTLSGYLITDILLGQWASAGRPRLRDFWLRRARRLLPALFVMLAVVAVWVAAFARGQLPGFRGDVVASALYVSNWWYIAQHASYYAQFAPPGVLDHLWSLAVEEQFYLVWPWLVLSGVWVLGRRRGTRRWLAAGTLVLAAVSAILMAVLYQPGLDPTRVYEGTDTRAFGLLIGAALAAVWPTRRAAPLPAHARRRLDLAGVAGLVIVGLLVWRTNQYSPFMFRGGLVVLSVATALAVAAVAVPGSLLGRALGGRPLRWLGVRSYGVYLWHYPVILLAAPAAGAGLAGGAGVSLSAPRAVACVIVSVALAAASWRFVEEPARLGFRRPRRSEPAVRLLPRLTAWLAAAWFAVWLTAAWLTGWLGVHRRLASPLAAGGVCVVMVAGVITGVTVVTSRLAGGTGRPAAPGGRAAMAAGLATASGTQRQADPGTPAAASRPAPAPRTSCRSVVHIGDSTSDGLISPGYLPNPAERITARYAQVGVRHSIMEVTGGTSIVETIDGTPNAYRVAERLIDHGYRGCWVLALGTNDTADVYAGSNVGRVQRIKEMMSLIGNQPVLWIEVKSLVPGGPYAEQNMRLWNRALAQERPRYPAMRLYDWPAVARDSWFIDDGIHYTSYGYAQRARLIADALAAAFPAPSS
jgi:peptidoglycan/LPS O-acetylase OafA/YrhL/lysophospholipase L1-like esterase